MGTELLAQGGSYGNGGEDLQEHIREGGVLLTIQPFTFACSVGRRQVLRACSVINRTLYDAVGLVAERHPSRRADHPFDSPGTNSMSLQCNQADTMPF